MLTAEQEKVSNKIKALLAKNTKNGATEAESMSAALKAGELLQAFNLTLDQIYLNNQKCVTLTIETNNRRKIPVYKVVGSIAEFCDCKAFYLKGQTLSVNFFGLESDTLMCKYLFEIIEDSLDSETIKFKYTDIYKFASDARKTLTVSFQKGMIDRINSRLSDMTDSRKREENTFEEVSGTSIILIKNNKVEEEYKEVYKRFKLKPSYNYNNCNKNYNAYYAGHDSGDNVNLNRPLATSGSMKLLN